MNKDGKSSRIISPIKLDGKIIKDAVDPDVIEISEGQLKLFYYVGLFTKPVTLPKPNKFYSVISKDGVNFKTEGVVAQLNNSSDPTVARLKDGSYLLAIPQIAEMIITILRSADGRNFKKSVASMLGYLN